MSWHCVRNDRHSPGYSRTPVSAAWPELAPGSADAGAGALQAAVVEVAIWTAVESVAIWWEMVWTHCITTSSCCCCDSSRASCCPSLCRSWALSTGSIVVRVYCYGSSQEPNADQGLGRIEDVYLKRRVINQNIKGGVTPNTQARESIVSSSRYQ